VNDCSTVTMKYCSSHEFLIVYCRADREFYFSLLELAPKSAVPIGPICFPPHTVPSHSPPDQECDQEKECLRVGADVERVQVPDRHRCRGITEGSPDGPVSRISRRLHSWECPLSASLRAQHHTFESGEVSHA